MSIYRCSLLNKLKHSTFDGHKGAVDVKSDIITTNESESSAKLNDTSVKTPCVNQTTCFKLMTESESSVQHLHAIGDPPEVQLFYGAHSKYRATQSAAAVHGASGRQLHGLPTTPRHDPILFTDKEIDSFCVFNNNRTLTWSLQQNLTHSQQSCSSCYRRKK